MLWKIHSAFLPIWKARLSNVEQVKRARCFDIYRIFPFCTFCILYTLQIFWIWYILFYECMALRIFCILYVLHFAHFALCTFCKCLIFTRYFHFAQGGGGSHFWMHRINQHVGCSAPLPLNFLSCCNFAANEKLCRWENIKLRKSDLQNTNP